MATSLKRNMSSQKIRKVPNRPTIKIIMSKAFFNTENSTNFGTRETKLGTRSPFYAFLFVFPLDLKTVKIW